MHLTDVDVEEAGLAKGDGSNRSSDGPDSLHTASIAADLTQLDESSLKSDDASNICAGAALLSTYQRDLGNAKRRRKLDVDLVRRREEVQRRAHQRGRRCVR